MKNFKKFSLKSHKNYTAGANFTRPPVVTVATNLNSANKFSPYNETRQWLLKQTQPIYPISKYIYQHQNNHQHQSQHLYWYEHQHQQQGAPRLHLQQPESSEPRVHDTYDGLTRQDTNDRIWIQNKMQIILLARPPCLFMKFLIGMEFM